MDKDNCPVCGGGFYGGSCKNGYHSWIFKPWPLDALIKEKTTGDKNAKKNK